MRSARIVATIVVLALAGTAGSAAATSLRRPAVWPPAGYTAYTVRGGDRLEVLARRYATSVPALQRVNRLRNPHLIRIGQRLWVPRARPAAVRGTARFPARLRARPERLALAPRFDRWARAYRVPPDLLKATAWVESGWQSRKVSTAGAVGIGQLMPDTVRFVSGRLLRARLDPRRPDDNIRMSARYLRYLLDQHGGRADRALASYYQGLRAVRQRGVLRQTRAYVATVNAFRPRFG